MPVTDNVVVVFGSATVINIDVFDEIFFRHEELISDLRVEFYSQMTLCGHCMKEITDVDFEACPHHTERLGPEELVSRIENYILGTAYELAEQVVALMEDFREWHCDSEMLEDPRMQAASIEDVAKAISNNESERNVVLTIVKEMQEAILHPHECHIVFSPSETLESMLHKVRAC